MKCWSSWLPIEGGFRLIIAKRMLRDLNLTGFLVESNVNAGHREP